MQIDMQTDNQLRSIFLQGDDITKNDAGNTSTVIDN